MPSIIKTPEVELADVDVKDLESLLVHAEGFAGPAVNPR
jgi:hypothetical protein